MAFDLEEHNLSWKSKAIVEGLPKEVLEPLLERDGTTRNACFSNDGKGQSRPSWMYALGLVEGAAGAHVAGWDWGEWLTPLGQAVVDRMKS